MTVVSAPATGPVPASIDGARGAEVVEGVDLGTSPPGVALRPGRAHHAIPQRGDAESKGRGSLDGTPPLRGG